MKLLLTGLTGITLLALTPTATLAANIGIFSNPLYTTDTTIGGVLQSQGDTVSTFSGLDAITWTNITSANDIVIMTSQWGQNIYPLIPVATRQVIQNYVSNGGVLLFLGDPFTVETMNDLFGTTVVGSLCLPISTCVTTLSSDAIGTAYEGGPTSLNGNLANVFAVDTASVPVGSLTPYNLVSRGVSSIALWNQGGGKLGYLGWDWNESPGRFNQQLIADWNSALDATVTQALQTQSVPESNSPLSLLCLGFFIPLLKVFNKA